MALSDAERQANRRSRLMGELASQRAEIERLKQMLKEATAAPPPAPASAPAAVKQDNDTAPYDPDEMPATMRKRFEATLKKRVNAIRNQAYAEEHAKVYVAYDGFLKSFQERIDRADRILESHKGVMSREQFRKLRGCLHPDHNTFHHAAEAFQEFGALEKVLVKPEESELTHSGSPLPKTAAEMMARRRASKRS